jgi:molybdopterin-containing oxidoreductase family membrane subunit
MFVVSIILNLGMWLERWMIIQPTLANSFHPIAFKVMYPSIVQWAIVFGSFGWFGLLFLVFVKVFPSVSMYEVKEMVYHRRELAGKDPETVLSSGGSPGSARAPA